MNTMLNNSPVAVASNPVVVTHKMIAEKLGLSKATVDICMCKNPRNYSEKTVDLVRSTAKEMGYVPRAEKKAAREQEKQMEYLRTHNFPSKEMETQRMVYLREQGFSNREIAKKIGRCVLTVRRRIGAQEKDMSTANRAQGAKNRAARNVQRWQYVADHTVREYNGLVEKVDELRREVKVVEEKIVEMQPKVKEAAKVSKIAMLTSLSEAPATAIQ